MKNRYLLLAPLTVLLAMSISSCGASRSSNDISSDSNNPTSQSHQEGDIAVEGVSLNYDSLTLNQGKTVSLIANISPTDASNKEVTWSSSNESVATVDNGKVTALALGNSNITVTTVDGGFVASCKITVVAAEEEVNYNPDTNDSSIYFITNDTLSNGSLADGEYTFTINSNYKQIYAGVSGMGAASARMILSSMTSKELEDAILSENVNALKSIKGIGLKSAQRMILELKDKIVKGEGVSSDALFQADTNAAADEAASALQMLGFTKANIQKAIQAILKANPRASVEQIIKSALQML